MGDGSQSNLTVFDAPANTWFHIAGTYDGRAMRLYVNGVESARAVAVNRVFATTGTPIVIGGNGDPSAPPFSGALDEVGVWRVALSRDEILELARSGIPQRTDAVHTFGSFGPVDDPGQSQPLTFLESVAAGDTSRMSTFWDSDDRLMASARARRPRHLSFPDVDEHRLLDEALWWAIVRGQGATAHRLLQRGADIDAMIGSGGSSSLHQAVARQDFEAVQFLIQQGADPTLEDRTHRSSSWEWAAHFDLPVLRAYLLDAASVTSLKAAVEYGDLSRVTSIVESGSVTSTALDDALRRAASGGHVEIADHLLQSGADVASRDSRGRRAVDRAIRASRYELVDFLRKKGGEAPSVPFLERVGQLDSAIESRDTVAAQDLLDADPDLVFCDSEAGRTWFQRAADVNDGALVRLLVRRGASIGSVRATPRSGGPFREASPMCACPGRGGCGAGLLGVCGSRFGGLTGYVLD